MTVKELYEWAIQNDCVDYEINVYGCGTWYPINENNLMKDETEEGNYLEIG